MYGNSLGWGCSKMEAQFIRIAGELGWDLDMQIAKLEEFVSVAGRDAAWQDFIGWRRPQGAGLRDTLLQFVAASGYSGAFTRFMLSQMPRSPRAVSVGPPSAQAGAAMSPDVQAVQRPGFMAWLRRRRDRVVGR
jgi:hypothetical protein